MTSPMYGSSSTTNARVTASSPGIHREECQPERPRT
jgi:hypothetical protein